MSGHGKTAGATHINRAERKTITDIQVARRAGLPGPGAYGSFRTPSREAEIRNLKRAALQQVNASFPLPPKSDDIVYCRSKSTKPQGLSPLCIKTT